MNHIRHRESQHCLWNGWHNDKKKTQQLIKRHDQPLITLKHS